MTLLLLVQLLLLKPVRRQPQPLKSQPLNFLSTILAATMMDYQEPWMALSLHLVVWVHVWFIASRWVFFMLDAKIGDSQKLFLFYERLSFSNWLIKNSRECYCGNTYDRYGAATDNCKMACADDPSEICGNAWTNSVYSTCMYDFIIILLGFIPSWMSNMTNKNVLIFFCTLDHSKWPKKSFKLFGCILVKIGQK